MNKQLSDLELNAAVAEKVMGYKTRTVEANDMLLLCAVDHCDDRDWIYEGEKYVWKEMKDHQPEWRIPNYSTDISSAMEMECALAKQGLGRQYVAALREYMSGDWIKDKDEQDWRLITAPPRARCLAALSAINGDDPKP